MRITRRKAIAIAIAGPAALAALPAHAATHNVTIQGRKFIPAELTISAGDTVVFTNVSGRHTATALDGSFDTGSLSKGGVGEITVSTKGTYPYRCTFHHSMKGTITVV